MDMRKRLFILALAAIAAANTLAIAQEEPKCLDVTPSALKEGEILLLYGSEANPGVLEALVTFDGTDFKEAYNRYFRGIKEAFRVDDGKTFPISYDTYSAQPGADKCYWAAKLESKKSVNDLFASPKLKFTTKIDEATRTTFNTINTACVTQVDSSNNPKSACTKPVLKGVSDLNKNGRLEFWYTSPHPKATGFAVAEPDESGTLKIIAEK
jgi:hypothetical protein